MNNKTVSAVAADALAEMTLSELRDYAKRSGKSFEELFEIMGAPSRVDWAPQPPAAEVRKMTVTKFVSEASKHGWDVESVFAELTECGVTGCDGTMHDPAQDQSEWAHRVADEYFDGSSVEVAIWVEGSTVDASINLRANSTMSADDFRREADIYETYPAWLRSMADRIDALKAGVE
jgi:hypothetical protein